MISGDSQDVDPSYLEEVDQRLAEDARKVLDLPSVPTTIPSVGKEERKEKGMELE